SLRKVFTFSQAAMLVEPESSAAPADRLTCIVADPEALVGSCWPVGALFRKVMRGRVITTFSNGHCEEWQGDHVGPLSAGQSALDLPVRVREQRGILMLLRDAGAEGFRRSHVGQAKRFSVLVSHALATRFATESAEEKQQLRELTEQLRSSERAA